ncbi:MAG TPA: TadE family protein [Amnibacterium sp.]|jgi:Flp pilus assembly protein TadG|nr:TadE family protein [Amnibacterium sp.]
MQDVHDRKDRGSVAVEFALVLPILATLLIGVIEFGNAYGAQLAVTNAAREAARTMAVQNSVSAAQSAALAAAQALTAPAMTASEVSVSPSACSVGSTATVTIRYPFAFLTGYFGAGFTMTGKAAMQCGG